MLEQLAGRSDLKAAKQAAAAVARRVIFGFVSEAVAALDPA